MLAVGLGYYGWRRVSPQVRKSLAEAAVKTLTEDAAIVAWMRKAAAPGPGWENLAAEVAPQAVLVRACLNALARSGERDGVGVVDAAADLRGAVARDAGAVRSSRREFVHCVGLLPWVRERGLVEERRSGAGAAVGAAAGR